MFSNDNPSTWIKVDRSNQSRIRTMLCWEHISAAGEPLLAASITYFEGSSFRSLMLRIPCNATFETGVRAYVRTDEKTDQRDSATDLLLKFISCNGAGCFAMGDATEEFLHLMSKGDCMIAEARDADNRPVEFTIPLNGFNKAQSDVAITYEDFSKKREDLIMRPPQKVVLPNTRELIFSFIAPGYPNRQPSD
ncbi:invasion associated locus B family protein [Hyphomicrobium sp.]|jgi:hypothetical protein|uniref:invasion associated locus B family protein n=1 Tax=Hyphomicrobium sp. TaxID=82 RepID=UPI0035614072